MVSRAEALVIDLTDAVSVGLGASITQVRPATLDFRSFFQTEYARLGRALFVLTGNRAEAEELTQDAMVRVYERWDRVSDMDTPAGYLYRTALNLHRSKLRRLATRARQPIRHPSGPDHLAEIEDRDELGRLLETLPMPQRQALVLVELLGMSAEEAGRILRIEPVSVRVRLSRARSLLRQRAGDGDD
jgi:RNA polymerase sigma-70 factor (ECF subfamily)